MDDGSHNGVLTQIHQITFQIRLWNTRTV